MSVLHQNEHHEQIEIMANNGPYCKGIENDKRNIFESELWKKNSECIMVRFLSPSVYVKHYWFTGFNAWHYTTLRPDTI